MKQLRLSGFPHAGEAVRIAWPKRWRRLRELSMSAVSLESRSDVDAPPEAAGEATPLPQEPARPSPLSLDAIRPLLEAFAALRPQSLEQLLPALRILGLSVVAGIGLKLTAAVLGSIDELPLLGRLLQLVGLVTAIQFLSRNALQQQQRAVLLARIETLRRDLLG